MHTLSAARRLGIMITLIAMLAFGTVASYAQAEDYATPVGDAPVEESTDTSVDGPVDETPDTPVEEPVDDSTDTPVDEELENSTDDSTDAPGDGTDNPPVEEPIENTVATPTGVPDGESIGTPAVEAPIPPSIHWSQPNPITCRLLAGHPEALDLNATATYLCTANITTEITGDPPADTAIIWTLQATYSGDAVSITLPDTSTAEILPPDVAPDGIDARLRARVPFAQSEVTFDVHVTRTTCTVNDAMLTLTAEPTFVADGVSVIRTDIPTDTPFVLTTSAAVNGQPEISFAGPITFEALSATSTGLDSQVSRGTATIVVTGNWNPCADYTLYLTGSMQLPEFTSATLRVVAVINESIPGGACVLATGCALAALPASGDAATPLQFTVQLEVEFDGFMLPGDYGMTVTAGTEAVQAQP
ncbi:MAG: hypothetical protein M9950_05635 [Thermomicrobiales bacterium]|nr:hypothetical protein [Thermomicrobiales bacterium]